MICMGQRDEIEEALPAPLVSGEDGSQPRLWVGVAQRLSGCLSEGIVLGVAVHLGCPWEDIRRLLCHHLGLELHVIYFLGSFLLLWRPRQGTGRTG